MTDGVPAFRIFDDDTLLDMYDHAHEIGDEHCEAIAAELVWRGIEVARCGKQHEPTAPVGSPLETPHDVF